ncbi:unnamed protein product [Dibothriocephalus latus]|uniref:FERM C-terminal PH-like domain-containing protein n=1 Tax=Dibothriocephalus latus TaxID=60516 RepID=A0A3P7N0F9_DIBLA|nr:unnamed protein product [Dibothriocephalus latus]
MREVKFTCGTTALAKRLYSSCVEHHAFFRLRGPVRTTACEPFPFPTDTRLVQLHLDGVRTFSGTVSRVGTLPLNSQPPSSRSPCLNPARPFSEPDIRGILRILCIASTLLCSPFFSLSQSVHLE